MNKFVVCPECEGEGKFGPGWVWTEDQMAQEDPDEFAELQARLRDGEFDQKCEFCKGERVVNRERNSEHREWAEYQAEVAAEQRYFGSLR